MRRALTPDPNKEERAFRERLRRATRTDDRGKQVITPECKAIAAQIAEQQPMLHSLRSELRAQARGRVDALTNEFRASGC